MAGVRWKEKQKLWWECHKCQHKTEKLHKKCRSCKHRGTSSKDRECSPPPKHETWQCRICTYKKNEGEKCKMCGEAKPKYASYPEVDQDLRNSYREQRTKKKNFNRTLLKNGRSVRVAEKRKSDEEMAKMYMRNITDFCKGQGIPYVDNDFPDPDAPDGGRDDIEWLRIKDIKLGKYKGMVVYDESSSKQNVLQGELADCWFSTALASIGGRHELLKRIFLSTEVSPEGFYFLRLCKDGAWKTVLIDDRLPCDRRKHTLKYSNPHIDKNGNVQLWPMLIQKAAAKLHGSYIALSSGIVVEALSMLTGEACDHIVLTEFEDKKQIPKVEPKDISCRLLQAKSEMFLMGVTTAHEKRNVTGFQETGLIAEHAYSVLDVCEIEGQQLIKLRNPWSVHNLDKCLLNAEEDFIDLIKTKLHTDEQEFWITLDDLLRYFVSLGICKVREQWFEMRVKGSLPPVFDKPWKYVTFSVHRETQLDVELFQRNLRGRSGTEDFNDLLIVVAQNSLTEDRAPYVKQPLFMRVMGHSQRRARSFVSCDCVLGEGSYTVACLGFWQLQYGKENMTAEESLKWNKEFNLVLHSSHDLTGPEEVDISRPHFKLLEYAPSDLLILLTKQLASEKTNSQTDRRVSELHTDSGLTARTYSLLWWGEVLVLENETDVPIAYQRSYGKSKLLLYSRKEQTTKDCVPPKSSQVIHVVTAMHPDTDWHVAVEKGYKPSPDMKEEHLPAITMDIRGLHATRPIHAVDEMLYVR